MSASDIGRVKTTAVDDSPNSAKFLCRILLCGVIPKASRSFLTIKSTSLALIGTKLIGKVKLYTSHITLQLSQALTHIPDPKPMSSNMEIRVQASELNRISWVARDEGIGRPS